MLGYSSLAWVVGIGHYLESGKRFTLGNDLTDSKIRIKVSVVALVVLAAMI